MVKPITEAALSKTKAIFIAGSCGAGKSCLAYSLLEKFNKQIYFVRHPKPELIEAFGYNNLLSLDEIEHLSDCVIYWDEPGTYLSVSDFKKNQILCKILSLARQRNITLIISTSDTRAFIKGTEAYFDCWIVKDIEYSMTKQRSQIRKVIQDNVLISPEDFRLNVNEFLFYSRNLREMNGKHTFDLPTGWTDELSTPYGTDFGSVTINAETVKNSEKKLLLNETIDLTRQKLDGNAMQGEQLTQKDIVLRTERGVEQNE